jgi:alpha-L-fucosidase
MPVRSLREYRDEIEKVAEGGPFVPDWDSFRARRIPEWYQDGKFGIFIHWGVYSVPAFGNEWYPRNMYLEGTAEFAHHRERYGDQARFGYKGFIPEFTASRYDPAAWAALFRRAGAQFVVPVAEHHDGFAMYDSALSQWDAASMGPRRDLIGDLAQAVREQGMVFGVSSHRAEHWWFMNGGRAFASDVRDPRFAGFYGPAQPRHLPPNEQFLEDWLVRCCELVDRYEPHLFWFDWWIEEPAFAPYLQIFASYFYNRGHQWRRKVAINYKHKAFPPGTAVLDIERGQLEGIREEFWQTDTSVATNSWGYTEGNAYREPGEIIGNLVDIVSKNGALLLNIGPRADGTVPEQDQAILHEIGDWLLVNGEAIYGTRPWVKFGEGPTKVVPGPFADTRRDAFTATDIRFTTRAAMSEGQTTSYVYATALALPDDDQLTIETLGVNGSPEGARVTGVTLVDGTANTDRPLAFEQRDGALVVTLAAELPSRHAVSVRIELEGKGEAPDHSSS